MIKQTKGITLIALIITIIVLLILAGVTINMVLGDNGLFNKAKTSVAKYENAQERENSTLSRYETEIDNTRDTVTIPKDEYERIRNIYNYSEDSKIAIGTYTKNGISKTIYRQVLTGTSANTVGGTVSLGNLQGVGTVLNIYGSITMQGNVVCALNWYYSSGNCNDVWYYDGNVYFRNGDTRGISSPITIVIEYIEE